MPTQPNDLLAGRTVGDLERTAVRRAPDGLHHVPEVEAALAEIRVASRVRWRTERHSIPPSRPRWSGSMPVLERTSTRPSRPERRLPLVRSSCSRGPLDKSGLTRRGDRGIPAARTASATVTRATASVHEVWNGVGWPLPGRDDHRQRNEPQIPSRGCARATTTSSSAK